MLFIEDALYLMQKYYQKVELILLPRFFFSFLLSKYPAVDGFECLLSFDTVLWHLCNANDHWHLCTLIKFRRTQVSLKTVEFPRIEIKALNHPSN